MGVKNFMKKIPKTIYYYFPIEVNDNTEVWRHVAYSCKIFQCSAVCNQNNLL